MSNNELLLIYGHFSKPPSEIKKSCLLSVFLFRKIKRSEAAKPDPLFGCHPLLLVQAVALAQVVYVNITDSVTKARTRFLKQNDSFLITLLHESLKFFVWLAYLRTKALSLQKAASFTAF